MLDDLRLGLLRLGLALDSSLSLETRDGEAGAGEATEDEVEVNPEEGALAVVFSLLGAPDVVDDGESTLSLACNFERLGMAMLSEEVETKEDRSSGGGGVEAGA